MTARVALIYVGAAAAVFLLLRLVAAVLMAIARARAARALDRPAHGGRQYPPAGRADADHRAVARPRHRAAGDRDRDRRQSAPAIHRRAAGQGAVVLFPRHPVRARPSASTPSCARRRRRAKLEEVPMLRGRIVAANGIARRRSQAEPTTPPGCCKATAASPMRDEVPAGSRLVDGQWWGPDYDGPPLVSFEKRIADGLGLKLGDAGHGQRARPQHHRDASPICARSTGRASASISSWCSRRNTFRGAPHTQLATLTYPDGGTPAQEGAHHQRAVAERFPDGHHGAGEGRARGDRRAWSPIWCSASAAPARITLIAAALVLGGALAAGHRHRVYDAVILKTLGATRRAAARAPTRSNTCCSAAPPRCSAC